MIPEKTSFSPTQHARVTLLNLSFPPFFIHSTQEQYIHIFFKYMHHRTHFETNADLQIQNESDQCQAFKILGSLRGNKRYVGCQSTIVFEI